MSFFSDFNPVQVSHIHDIRSIARILVRSATRQMIAPSEHSCWNTSAGACEQYFDAADRVTEIVDLYFDDLGSISQEQRLLLASEYTGAIRDQAGQALILNLAMASEGLDTGAFGEGVQDLVALLSVQVQSLDSGATNDVTTLLRIQRLENQIAAECRKIGGDV